MGAIDVDRVRFSEERRRCAELAAACDRLRAPVVIQWQGDYVRSRRELRSRGLLLTETIAPGAIRALREAKAALGLTWPVELYQTSRYVDANALMRYSNPPCIEVIGHYLASLDALALIALFGHELGHLLAQGPDSMTHHIRRRCSAAGIDDSQASLACELTADRFGLLACRDLGAALRLEMISLAGLAGPAMTWDTDAYLDECRALVAELLARREWTIGSSHPEHGVRAYAVWLFSESDVYREVTGQGSGSRPLAEIDAQLAKLLPPFREPRVAPKPAPAPATASTPPPTPPGPPIPRAPPPSAVPSLRAQLDYAMKDIRGKLSAMLAPADPVRAHEGKPTGGRRTP